MLEFVFPRKLRFNDALDLMKFVKNSDIKLVGFDAYMENNNLFKSVLLELFDEKDCIDVIKHDSLFLSNNIDFTQLEKTFTNFISKQFNNKNDNEPTRMKIAKKAIENRLLLYKKMPQITPNLRDSVMAENIEWICNTLYQNEKIIIWSHNTHIRKSNDGRYHVMGSLLSDSLKKQSYFLGLYAYSGSTGLNDSEAKLQHHKKNSLNKIINYSNHEISFVDFSNQQMTKENSWMFKKLNVLE